MHTATMNEKEPTQEPVAPQVTKNSPSSRVEPSPKMRTLECGNTPAVCWTKIAQSKLDKARLVRSNCREVSELVVATTSQTRDRVQFFTPGRQKTMQKEPISTVACWKMWRKSAIRIRRNAIHRLMFVQRRQRREREYSIKNRSQVSPARRRKNTFIRFSVTSRQVTCKRRLE